MPLIRISSGGGYYVDVLLNELSIIEIYPQWKFILPGALILFGIRVLFDSLRKPAKGSFHVMHGGKPLVNQCSCEDDRFFCATSFGQNTYPILLPRLSGGNAEVSFGNMTVDLRECEALTDNCRIDLDCSFGQLELRIPSPSSCGAPIGDCHRLVLRWLADSFRMTSGLCQ